MMEQEAPPAAELPVVTMAKLNRTEIGAWVACQLSAHAPICVYGTAQPVAEHRTCPACSLHHPAPPYADTDPMWKS